MIPTPPKPKYVPGARLRVTQYVRVGHRRWLTCLEGTVVREGRRPVGGIEMGGKASYCQQETFQLRADDGSVTDVAIDAQTEVEVLGEPAPAHVESSAHAASAGTGAAGPAPGN